MRRKYEGRSKSLVRGVQFACKIWSTKAGVQFSCDIFPFTLGKCVHEMLTMYWKRGLKCVSNHSWTHLREEGYDFHYEVVPLCVQDASDSHRGTICVHEMFKICLNGIWLSSVFVLNGKHCISFNFKTVRGVQ